MTTHARSYILNAMAAHSIIRYFYCFSLHDTSKTIKQSRSTVSNPYLTSYTGRGIENNI